MQLYFLIFIFLAFAPPEAAEALPPIVIYSFTPAPPVLALSSITPTNHQSFTVPPPSVSLNFSAAIDPAASAVQIFDPYNNLIAATQTIQPGTHMEIALPQHLLAGAYRIEWKAVCACAGKDAINGTSYFVIY